MSIKERGERASVNLQSTRSPELPEGAMLDPRALSVIEFMKTNLHAKISLARLAAVARLSPSRLSHLFKGETGLPPVEYLIRLRMQKARDLLATTRLSVKQVMATVGYDNASNFARHFKERFQLSPSGYRKRVESRKRKRQDLPTE